MTLYGLTLVARRRVSYGPIDPAAAREVFIREALVGGDFDTPAPFFAHNRSLIAEVAELEHKARRQDVLVDEQTIAAFYAERVGAGISTRVAFERWRREAEAADPRRAVHDSRDADAPRRGCGHRRAVPRISRDRRRAPAARLPLRPRGIRTTACP